MGIIREVAKAYKGHDGVSLSANISFFAILSLIPLVMIAMSVAGYLLGGTEGLFDEIMSALTGVLPKGGAEFSENLKSIIEGRSRIGGAAVALLLFIASLLFSSIEHAMDKIFESEKRRNFLHSRLISILLVFGVTLLLFMPTMIQLFSEALAKFRISIPLAGLAESKAFFPLMAIFSFISAVMIIPAHRVKLRYALIGGAFFAFAVVIAKFIFRWYIVHAFDRYNLIYGSLTVLVVSAIWIFYLANILIISSELVAVLQRRYSSCKHNEASGRRA